MDHEQEHRRHHHLDDEAARKRIAAGRMLAVAIRGEAGGDFERRNAAGHEVEDAGAGQATEHLGHDVPQRVFRGKPPAGHEARRHGRIQMAARHVAHRRRHRKHGKAERERDADEPDAEVGICRGQHRAAAAAEHEPKGSDRLRQQLAHDSMLQKEES